nr:secreted protein [Achlya hypogyna]
MQPILIVSALLAAASAADIFADENLDVIKELEAWKSSHAGKKAVESGFVPNVETNGRQEGATSLEAIELERFKATKAVVEQLNKDYPDAEFSTDNPFALLTEDEFAQYVMGSFGQDQRKLRTVDHVARELTPEQREAGDVDWSSHKCNEPIKNQGQCGSCWTFSSIGVASFADCLATGSLLDLSQQQLVSCARAAGQGCQGGWPWKALDYIRETGVCTSSDYPYQSGQSKQDGQCKQSCNKKKLQIGETVEIQGESALQSALDHQAVQVVVEAGNNVWKNYKSGVIRQCPGAQSDHAVLAVGYGTKDGIQHFKIKNSWGTGWGEGGYMYLQRGGGGKGMCNVAEHPSYPKLTKAPHPSSDKPMPTSGAPTPTSRGPKPKPSSQRPEPSSQAPSNKCNGCTGCYYPNQQACQPAFDKGTCDIMTPYYGTVWCGN